MKKNLVDRISYDTDDRSKYPVHSVKGLQYKHPPLAFTPNKPRSTMPQQEEIDPETPYQSADLKPQRRGKLFFWFCDMRVATVGVNVLNILVILIGMIVHMIKYLGIMPISVAAPAFILSGIGIFGAVNFELWAVTMSAAGFMVGLLCDLWWLNIFGIVMGCLVLYPTATLAQELHKGIMTKETYSEREEFVDFEKIERAGIKKEYLTNFHENFGEYIGTKPAATTTSN